MGRSAPRRRFIDFETKGVFFMPLKRFCRAAVCLLLLFCLAACGSDLPPEEPAESDALSQIDSVEDVSSGPAYARNALTGLYDLPLDRADARPVGVMVNNLRPNAWRVQTGVTSADLVYEMVTEGGITRLCCLYQDLSRVGDIGSVRSARYSFGDLMVAHDALLVHCGMDERYARQHFNEIGLKNYDFFYHDAGSFRANNGEAYEHRLFTNGAQLYQVLSDNDVRLTSEQTARGTWVDFAPPEQTVKPAGGECAHIRVQMSASKGYTDDFLYDDESGLYRREQGEAPHCDAATGEQIAVKNVFVLFTDVSYFSDGEHVKQDLSSGEGYYVSAGAYQKIRWKKGGADDPLAFTDENGAPITCNAGKSWVCITDTGNRAKTEIGAPSTPSALAQE